MKVLLSPLDGMPRIQIPRLQMTDIRSDFSLADIIDLAPSRLLGRRLTADPTAELRRRTFGAKIEVGPDGLKRTVLVSTDAADRVFSEGRLLPMEDLVRELTDSLMGAPVVPARKGQRDATQPIIEAFVEGLGNSAQEVLSAFFGRATERLINRVVAEQKRYAVKPAFREVIELSDFGPDRTGRSSTSSDLTGRFSRSTGYAGWKRSLYEQVWFDSSPERTVANILDSSHGVACWIRLHRGALPILWNSFGAWYNPDFLVVETDGTHWVVEVKADRDLNSPDVQGKREAAERWANHVSVDEAVKVRWRYLLVSESDVRDVRGSWGALKRLHASLAPGTKGRTERSRHRCSQGTPLGATRVDRGRQPRLRRD